MPESSRFDADTAPPLATQRHAGAHAATAAAGAALAIVLPVLDEGDALAARLRALAPLRARGAMLIVVDGGSCDDSLALARAHADLAFVAPRGRASQMNAGAAAALDAGAGLLLFLHADTSLPERADDLVRNALLSPRPRGGRQGWGRFDVRIDSPRRVLRVVGRAMNLRSRLTGIATGDQGLFVTRAAFEAACGFPEQALMEDIEMSKRLKKRVSRPVCLNPPVVTSARRWEKNGVWRTIVLMWRLRAAYFFGADPAVLARRYGYAPHAESLL